MLQVSIHRSSEAYAHAPFLGVTGSQHRAQEGRHGHDVFLRFPSRIDANKPCGKASCMTWRPTQSERADQLLPKSLTTVCQSPFGPGPSHFCHEYLVFLLYGLTLCCTDRGVSSCASFDCEFGERSLNGLVLPKMGPAKRGFGRSRTCCLPEVRQIGRQAFGGRASKGASCG